MVTGKEVTHFDVILLDAELPMMDGYAACERICSFLAQDKIVDGVPQTLPHRRDLLHALVICITTDDKKYKKYQADSKYPFDASFGSIMDGEVATIKQMVDKRRQDQLAVPSIQKEKDILSPVEEVSKPESDDSKK